ncbi:DUF4288 domain-containing protein [Nonomuraea sp. NPDC049419]|uniref:DUF4288 domain-containing protein n=1 Tax=Nonomuraea sp. NPDC049419 TaxID=3155772 RepID=UPI00342B5D05
MGETQFLWSVVLIYRTDISGGYTPPRFSEDVRVVRADSEDAAQDVAIALGREDEVRYGNTFDEEVTWRFLGIASLQLLQIDEPEAGATLLSRSFDSLDRYRDLFEVDDLPEEPQNPL